MQVGDTRTVYAVLPDGSQIVRYGIAKRWYHEEPDATRIAAFRRVSDAAALAHGYGAQLGGRSQPQGSYFYKYYRGLEIGELVPEIRRYTAAGWAQRLKWARSKYLKEMHVYSLGLEIWERNYGSYRRWYGEAHVNKYYGKFKPTPPVKPWELKRAEAAERRGRRKAA